MLQMRFSYCMLVISTVLFVSQRVFWISIFTSPVRRCSRREARNHEQNNHLAVSLVIDPSNQALFLDLVKDVHYLVSLF